MTTDRTNTLLLPLSILVAVAVGAVLGHLFTRTDARSTAPTTVSITESKELIDAMHALRDEMSHAHEPHNELVSPPGMPTRTDVSQPTTDLSLEVAKELRAATAEFVQVVAELHEAVKRNSPPLPPPVFPKAQPNPAAVDPESRRSAVDLNGAYLFSTYQEVIDRFGAPTKTSIGEGIISWWFAGTSSGGLNFQFVDGRVTRVDGSQ